MEFDGSTGAARADEADRIYRAIFSAPVPEVIRDRFAHSSRTLDARASRVEREEYDRVLDSGADLEAVELAARLTGRVALLSRKFRLMVYIAETVPANQHYFVNARDSRLRGWVTILFGALRTAVLLVRGLALLRGGSRA